jgi:hypothetical protein
MRVGWFVCAVFLSLGCWAAPPERTEPGKFSFHDGGTTLYGNWRAEVWMTRGQWSPGRRIEVISTLTVPDSFAAAIASGKGIKPDGFCFLVTAERTFDADGWLRLANAERMSTLLTPAGLPIEGGWQGALSKTTSSPFRTPVDQLAVVTIGGLESTGEGESQIRFAVAADLPRDLPPGIYRVRLDYGVTANKRMYSLNGDSFGYRESLVLSPPLPPGQTLQVISHFYSPPVPASGTHVSGRTVNAADIHPRLPWSLLYDYSSNGYRGVVADEDQPQFALSSRNLIQDDVILPMYSGTTRLSYSLEPRFPTDTIELKNNIPWDFSKGEVSVRITAPDGSTTDLGTVPFVAQNGQWPTTKNSALTAWRPPAYGYYTVKETGWIADAWGNRYEGGGTYHFWIANRMTLATATFQGMSFPVGSRYGRDIGFAPAVPADVEVRATLYVNSDAGNKREIRYTGRATPGGIFGAAQGMQQLPLDAPGEYEAHVFARYTDARGDLWICSMRHAGVVYPDDTPIVARGKKLYTGGKYVDRGETHAEGYLEPDGTQHLVHIGFPYQSGDVLLIASEGQGANKIEPALIYEPKEKPPVYDGKYQGVGASNLQITTSNGYSPHLFPEFIKDWAYYYGAGARPGFMGRFLVAEHNARAPYWPTSPNSFGSQINASTNGDLPGDIYRLLGGVVLRVKDQTPLYAGYLSSAFILPKGTVNNRVIAAGSEEVQGPTATARYFLVGTRPGMLYETGTSFAPAIQIDPIVPANITYSLDYPDGRQMVAKGTGDRFGSFAGGTRWALDVPGIYRYHLDADWQGYRGVMPGLPPSGGEFYVIEKNRPAGAKELALDLPRESTFPASGAVTITGTTTADSVYYSAVIPGAVIDQGYVPAAKGKFQLYFDPKVINKNVPTYDITYRVNGNPEIKDVVHLTFFSKEKTPGGETFHSFTRVILRGNTIVYSR